MLTIIKIRGSKKILLDFFDSDRLKTPIPKKSTNKLWSYSVRRSFCERFKYLESAKELSPTEIKVSDTQERNCFFCRKFIGQSLWLKNIFAIPYGYMHYILMHAVEPLPLFYITVIRHSIKERPLDKKERKYFNYFITKYQKENEQKCSFRKERNEKLQN